MTIYIHEKYRRGLRHFFELGVPVICVFLIYTLYQARVKIGTETIIEKELSEHTAGPACKALVTTDLKITDCSPDLARLLGCKSDEALQRDITEFFSINTLQVREFLAHPNAPPIIMDSAIKGGPFHNMRVTLALYARDEGCMISVTWYVGDSYKAMHSSRLPKGRLPAVAAQ